MKMEKVEGNVGIRGPKSSVTVAFLFAAILWGGCGQTSTTDPICSDCNVILVLADTLRADHLSTYGYGRETSPNLDRLAAEGIRLDQARSQSACTFPSVNSLLTSQPTFRFSNHEARPGIPREIPSLPTLLAAKGFGTAAVSASPIVRKTPSKHNPVGGFDQGFQHFDESCEWLSAACVTARASKLMDELPEPFFLYLHYMDPHDPYRPPERFKGRFATTYAGELDFVASGDPNPIQGLLREGSAEQILAEPDLAHLIDRYDEEILAFDQGLGNLFRELEKRDLRRKTIVVLASDHGEAFLEHEDIKHCRGVYDSLIRVPLLFWIPGVAEPATRSSPVSNLDIVPTILDLLGLEPPPMAGRSLRQVLASDEPVPALSFSAMGPYRSANDTRHKLIQHLGKESYELYDLHQDPAERHNLLPGERREFHRLKKELLLWSSEVETGISRQQRLELGEELEKELRALGYLG